MSFIKTILKFTLMSMVLQIPLIGQSVPWTYSSSPSTHYITINTTANPSFEGNLLSNGDAIGAFYFDQGQTICAGYGIWSTSTGTSIIAFGANGTISGGFAIGETFTFRLWRQSTNCQSDLVQVTFTSTTSNPSLNATNQFVSGGLSEINSFTSTGYSIYYGGNSNISNFSFCLSNNTISGLYPSYYLTSILTSTGTIFSSRAGLSIQSATGFVDLINSLAGNYTISAFSGTCIDYTQTTIELLAGPSSSFTTNTTTCAFSNFVLQPTTVSGTYQWSTGQNSASISVTSSGNYFVTVTDLNNCFAIDTFNIAFKQPQISSKVLDTLMCPNTSFLISPASIPGSYLWSTGQTTQSITVTTAGIYTLTVIDSIGCTISKDTTVMSNFPPPSIQLGNDTSICFGGTIILKSKIPLVNYVWSTGSQNPTLTISSTGTYFLTANDSHNCSISDSIKVTIRNQNTITLGKDTSFCTNGSIILTPQSTNNIQSVLWNSGSTSNSLTVNSAGIYSVKVIDSYGCSSLDSIKITLKDITLGQLNYTVSNAKCNQLGQISVDLSTISGDTPPLQYTFVNILTNSTTNTLVNHLETSEGLYELRITDVRGCSATYPNTIQVSKTNDCKNPILAPDSNGLLGSVFIPFNGTTKIFDKNGNLKKQINAPNNWDGTDDGGSQLPMGDYFVIGTDGNTLTITIIK